MDTITELCILPKAGLDAHKNCKFPRIAVAICFTTGKTELLFFLIF
jgi:hypothetical protein